jgi:hypothetical protein
MWRAPRLRPVLHLVAGNVAVLVVLLVVIEGVASYAVVIRGAVTAQSFADKQYTKYDADLGWVAAPSVYLPDMFGPGVALRTNAQGFRSDVNITPAVPNGTARIICSGDSFTFGFGVDNAQTWCALLKSLDSRLETVNLAEGGYGVDQAYLRYKRDAAAIEHHIHVFAFITDDFYRMLSNKFLGYPKPALEVDKETLVVRNVPVPRLSYYLALLSFSLTPRTQAVLRELRTVRVLRSTLVRTGGATRTAPSPTTSRGDPIVRSRPLVRAVFTDLKQLGNHRSSELVLVYLPTLQELRGKRLDGWTAMLESEAAALGLPFIDLFATFDALPDEQLTTLFIPTGSTPPWAAGHYSPEGNALAAQAIYKRLVSDAITSRKLSARWDGVPSARH